MQTFMDKQKNALLRKYHCLLRQCGISEDEKMALLGSYGVESGKDLNVYELTELCGKLDNKANPKVNDMDKWRKRLLASVGGYLKAMNKPNDIDQVKAIACRAAKVNNFNAISLERLKSLYNAFKQRTKDIESVQNIEAEISAELHKYIINN